MPLCGLPKGFGVALSFVYDSVSRLFGRGEMPISQEKQKRMESELSLSHSFFFNISFGCRMFLNKIVTCFRAGAMSLVASILCGRFIFWLTEGFRQNLLDLRPISEELRILTSTSPDTRSGLSCF